LGLSLGGRRGDHGPGDGLLFERASRLQGPEELSLPAALVSMSDTAGEPRWPSRHQAVDAANLGQHGDARYATKTGICGNAVAKAGDELGVCLRKGRAAGEA
jgi:hypothetical protein